MTADRVLPFQTEATGLRGRLVRVGPLLDEVLGRHPYPEPVARVLGETLVLAATLAATLKYDGVFTLQLKGDGPVSLMVADVVGGGGLASGVRTVRGYGRCDSEAVAAMAADPHMPPMALLGKGYLAFTVDQGGDTERYQGIVALRGSTLADCVRHYFLQSEQLPTGIVVAVERQAGAWRGGALLLQRLPGDGAVASDDDWQRAMMVMTTLTPAELTDPALTDGDLLYRLFHQDGVRVFEPAGLHAGCRCSRDKVTVVLRSLDPGDLESLRVDGGVSVNCEFCNTTYWFDESQLAAVRAENARTV
jgi:molecular chaperone Hsp33